MGKPEQCLHHPYIKMAHIPPSAPHPLCPTRPRAVCHTNSISYESGLTPVHQERQMTHFTTPLYNCRGMPVEPPQRKGMRENSVGQGRIEISIGSDSSFSLFLCTLLSCHLPSSFLILWMSWLMQTKHNHFTVQKLLHVDAECVLG